MLSANALKYNIIVKSSIYGGLTVFFLYFFIIVCAQLLFGFTFFSLFILLIIALYGGKKVYQQNYQLMLSDNGKVKLLAHNGEVTEGVISQRSFYNGLFISLQINESQAVCSALAKRKKSILVIYQDSVSDADFHLLARIIHFR